MGNSQASAATSTGAPSGFGSLFPAPPPPPTAAKSTGGDSSPTATADSASSGGQPTTTQDSGLAQRPPNGGGEDELNPGTYEDLHRKTKEIFPPLFEGGKLVVNKPLSNHFQISHTIQLSNLQPPCYKFGATYVGEKMVSPSEAYPVMFGDIDPSGNMTANVVHQFRPGLLSRFMAQYSDGKLLGYQLSNNFKGSNYTASATLGNVDLLTGTGLCVAQYLQRVSPRWDLGAELMYQCAPHVPGGQISVLSLATRYNNPRYTLSAVCAPMSNFHVCYYHKGIDNVQFGVEVETNARFAESTATFGYSVDLPKADVVFKGSVDSNWTVGAVMEKKLLPLPFTFMLSGMLSHVKGQSRFGIGLVIG